MQHALIEIGRHLVEVDRFRQIKAQEDRAGASKCLLFQRILVWKVRVSPTRPLGTFTAF